MNSFPVIDLFAGPGGLSFGFSGLPHPTISFRVALSIEKDETAHSTLLLRAFLRHLPHIPDAYYRYIRGEGKPHLEELKRLFPKQWSKAQDETKCWVLGQRPFSEVSRTISDALGGASNWVLLGGPPCQAYSIAGRSRMKNQRHFTKDHRHTLYREYLKIVAVHRPSVFVMENVKGILSSRHGVEGRGTSIFQQILEDLRRPVSAVQDMPEIASLLPIVDSQYMIYSFSTSGDPASLAPQDFVIRSEEWGIPQRRHRVVLLGVRNDLRCRPPVLSDLYGQECVSIEEVIGAMPRIRSRLSKGGDSAIAWIEALRACGAVCKGQTEVSFSRKMKELLRSLAIPRSVGAAFMGGGSFKPAKLAAWLWDQRLEGVIQHEARSHMASDLMRYFFASCSSGLTGKSPRLKDFPRQLLPRHKNAKSRKKQMDFADRFRVQIRGQAATTVTSHICKDGHYYIHYDPEQCRSLTVREAARIQTFPDSYFFEGNRTQQYHQVGNAVPPLLARKLASIVATLLMNHEKTKTVAQDKVAAVV